jgi:glutaredoxin
MEKQELKKYAHNLISKINYTNKLIIFGLSYCGYTIKAKEFAIKKRISFKYIEIDDKYNIFFKILSVANLLNPSLDINLNHNTFPIIFYNNKFIGGYDDLILFSEL